MPAVEHPIERWAGQRPRPELNTVCAGPSVLMDFDPYGNVLACCANVLYPLGNVRRSSLEEIWHGVRAEKLRDALARGDLGYGCGNCRHRLTYHGGEVPRDVYDDYVPDDGAMPTGPSILGFSLLNTCNLECVMCGADSSSRIRRNRSGLARLEPAYDDAFFEQLVPFLEGCRWTDFRGGEPFLVRDHFRVWDLLAEVNAGCPVSVTTNGMVWNSAVERVLDRFPTSVVLSFDAVDPALFEVIRVGSEFDTVVKHLDRFQAYCTERGTDLKLSYCLLQQNWPQFADVLRFAEGRGLMVSVHTVLEPGYGVQRLNDAGLAAVVRELEAQDRSVATELALNLDIWRRELERLRSELESRRRGDVRQWIGEPPGATNRPHVVAGMLAPADHAGWLGRLRRRVTRTGPTAAQELGAWSDSGLVGRLQLDPRGVIVESDLHGVFATLPLHADRVVGTMLEDFLETLELLSGGRLWVSEEFVAGDRAEHLLMLGHEDRDRIGLVIRSLSEPGPRGSVVVHLATDANLLPDRRSADLRAGEVAAAPMQVSVGAVP